MKYKLGDTIKVGHGCNIISLVRASFRASFIITYIKRYHPRNAQIFPTPSCITAIISRPAKYESVDWKVRYIYNGKSYDAMILSDSINNMLVVYELKKKK